MREIAFVDPGADAGGGSVLHDEAAYAHLLEVIAVSIRRWLARPRSCTSSRYLPRVARRSAPLREVGHDCWPMPARAVAPSDRTRLAVVRQRGSPLRRATPPRGHRRHRHAGERDRSVPHATGSHVDLWGRRAECRRIRRRASRIDASTRVPVADRCDDGARDRCAAVVGANRPAGARGIETSSVLIDLRAEGAQDPPPPIAPIVTLADVFAVFRRPPARPKREWRLRRTIFSAMRRRLRRARS